MIRYDPTGQNKTGYGVRSSVYGPFRACAQFPRMHRRASRPTDPRRLCYRVQCTPRCHRGQARCQCRVRTRSHALLPAFIGQLRLCRRGHVKMGRLRPFESGSASGESSTKATATDAPRYSLNPYDDRLPHHRPVPGAGRPILPHRGRHTRPGPRRAPIYSVVEEILEHFGTPYFCFKDIDENMPTGFIRIRVETIGYFLKRYREDMVRNKQNPNQPNPLAPRPKRTHRHPASFPSPFHRPLTPPPPPYILTARGTV